MKNILKSVFGFTEPKKRTVIALPSSIMSLIYKWEYPQNDIVIRSHFNRALYSEYLKTIKTLKNERSTKKI